MGAQEDGSTGEATHASVSKSGPKLGRASGRELICDTGGSERRAFPRHVVDCDATVTVLAGSGKIAGRMVDLSQGGCRLTTPERTLVGILVRVEVQFRLRGVAFRIVGVTAGSRTGKSFSVRFLDLPRRREEELADVLAEVAAANLIAEEEPAPLVAAAEAPMLSCEAPVVVSAGLAKAEKSKTEKAGVVVPAPAEPVVAKGHADRRSSSRHAVDTRATLILVKGGIRMQGQILNLSLGGCRLRTDERFNVGIYMRVEAEFYLHGLPFRVGGVSQAIVDKNTIGVRFLDISERRRDQLAELMEEIAEAEVGRNPQEKLPQPDAGSGEGL